VTVHSVVQTAIDQLPVSLVVAVAPHWELTLCNKKVKEVYRHDMIHSKSLSEYNQWIAFHKDGRRYEPLDWPLARSVTTGEVP
jgi:hypothetical protein